MRSQAAGSVASGRENRYDLADTAKNLAQNTPDAVCQVSNATQRYSG